MTIDDLYRMLRAGHSQLQGIVDTVHDPMLVLDRDLCVVKASRAFYKKFRVEADETLGRPIYELGNGQWDIPELRLLLEQVIPRAAAIIDFQVEHDFPGLGRRTILLTARSMHHADKLSRSMLLSMVDATERLQREARTEILFGEMRHRIRNLLASAQAMARLSSTEDRTVEEFRDEFMARFANLIRSTEMAFGCESGGLKSLVQATLAPYAADDAVVVEAAEDIDPGPSILVSLSLVLHELATNAAKYGSLSVPGGKVEIDWSYDATLGGLNLRWTERGGPPVAPPSRGGYGTKLIDSVIRYSLGGEQKQNFDPDGYSIDLFIPLAGADGPVTQPPLESEPDHANQSSGG